jgi:hypothetical protein
MGGAVYARSGRYWGVWRFHRDRAILANEISGQIPRTIKLGVDAAVSWIENFVTGGGEALGPWIGGLVMGGGQERSVFWRQLVLQISSLPIGDRLSEDHEHNSFSFVQDDVRFLVDIGSNCSTVDDVSLLTDVHAVATLVATSNGYRRYCKVGTLPVCITANGFAVTYNIETVYLDGSSPNKVCIEGLRKAGLAPSVGAAAGSLTVRTWQGGKREKHHLWLENNMLYFRGESAPVGRRGVREDDGAGVSSVRVVGGVRLDSGARVQQ